MLNVWRTALSNRDHIGGPTCSNFISGDLVVRRLGHYYLTLGIGIVTEVEYDFYTVLWAGTNGFYMFETDVTLTRVV